MDSDFIKRLANKARETSKTNVELLDEWKKHNWQYQGELSGAISKERVQVAGLGLGMVGITGIMGIAVANQAAAYGTSTLLASASTVMTGLGAVTIGSAALPVATVVALGTAVAGVAVLAINHFRGVDYEKADRILAEQERNLEINAIVDPEGRDGKLTAKNWILGAKKLIVEAIDSASATRFVEASKNVSANSLRERVIFSNLEKARNLALDSEITKPAKQAELAHSLNNALSSIGRLPHDKALHVLAAVDCYMVDIAGPVDRLPHLQSKHLQALLEKYDAIKLNAEAATSTMSFS